MSLGFVALGVLFGTLYGLLAVGLVLVYRSNKFLNLAHGQLGALAALVLAKLSIDAGWGYWIAFPLSIALGALTGIGVERLFVARLRAKTSSSVALLLLTIGVSELLLALLYIPALQPDQLKLAGRGYPLPFHTHFTFSGVVFGGQYVLVLILGPLLVGGLAAFLRLTMTGKMIRAAASNPDAARLCGISPRRVSAVTWGLAGALSAVSAVLQAPSSAAFSAPTLGPEALFLALGAAAFGAFVSIPMALVGGLVIGVVDQVTIGITSNAGTAQLVVFIVILIVVLFRGGAIGAAFATSGAAVEDRPPLRVPEQLRSRWIVRRQTTYLRAGMVFLGVMLPLLPGLQSEGRRFELTVILIYAVVGVSLTALIGWGGQLSLGHFAVVGLGALITARLAAHGWSLLMLLCAGVVGAIALVVIGLPALRVRGLTLAVTSLGLAVVANEWMLRQKWLTGSQTPNIDVTPIRVLRGLGHLGSLVTVYYAALALLTATVFAARAMRQSTPGRLMIAVRDDERASAANGITPAAVKLTTLAVTGFCAGAAGVLWAAAWRTVTPDQFPPSLSLAILAVPVIGGLGSASGAIAGAFALYFPVYFISPHLSGLFGRFGAQVGFQLALGGLSMVGVLLAYPAGIAGAAQRGWEKFLGRVGAQLGSRAPALRPDQTVLAARDVEVGFGGVRALQGVSIDLHEGEILGLIGPNGAGKSTLLNVISGAVLADSGSVTLLGRDISTLPPDLRSAYGLGRSFQAAHLFPGLTVRETVQAMLGVRSHIGLLSSIFRMPWATRAEERICAEADQLLERMGLKLWADTLTSDLSTGTRRICDLTVQLAGRPSVLLLDEPTAGVAQRESEEFGPLLRRLREELGCAIVIVEHDMPLLMGLCDRIYAMESGRVIAEGTPEEIRTNPLVISSYLGTDEAAIGRSGSTSGSGPSSARPRTARSATSRPPRVSRELRGTP